MSNLFEARVIKVRHWTDSLFSFTLERDASFRFLSGQFTMIGLAVDGRPLLRAYSIASAHYDEELEFFSIKVSEGPLTSRLSRISRGDSVLVGRKSTGTLLLDNLSPGSVLYLMGTGTGLAPFLSLIKDPETYERFERIVLVHGCREVAELAYQDAISIDLLRHEFVGEQARAQLSYYPTVTREPYRNRGRITDLLRNGTLSHDLGLPSPRRDRDRFMICGSPSMLADMTATLTSLGFTEGSTTRPGDYVVERAFVET